MKRSLSILLILTILVSCLSGCTFLTDLFSTLNDNSLENVSSAVFTLDVNPGVRVFVDDKNIVIGVEATNEDGTEVLAELSLTGKNYEAVVELIIDALEAKGYLEDEEASVLISIEKEDIEISEKLHKKIDEAFEKHGKLASVIEQELNKLNTALADEIRKLSKEYHISEGKAHLIEKILSEFPELSAQDLAKLNIHELAMMLEDVSESVKKHFTKFDKVPEGDYISRADAIAVVFASLQIPEGTELHAHARVTRQDGKMLYLIKFVYGELSYTFTVDAISGEILLTDSKEFVEFNPSGIIDEFCKKFNIPASDLLHKILGQLLGHKGDEPLSRGEILEAIFKVLNISKKQLKKTDVEIYEGDNGTVCAVTLEMQNGDVYHLVAEAYTGTVLQATLNGTQIELTFQHGGHQNGNHNHK